MVNSVSHLIDYELVEILKTTEDMWQPGSNNGKSVAMGKEVSMEIKATNDDGKIIESDFSKKAEYYFCKGTEHFFETGKLKKALKNFDNGIRYRPHDQSLRYIRGLCRYEMGYIDGARQDWARLKKLGGFDMTATLANYDIKNLKGYDELTTMFLVDK